MSRIHILLLSLTFWSAISAHAFGGNCEGEASAIMQSYGGQNLQLIRDGARGFGVNASGFVAYVYNLGDKECYLSFFLSGTYFGGACSQNTWGGREPNCGKIGTRTGHLR